MLQQAMRGSRVCSCRGCGRRRCMLLGNGPCCCVLLLAHCHLLCRERCNLLPPHAQLISSKLCGWPLLCAGC